MFFTKMKSNFQSISVYDLDERLGNINLVDIREPYEYKNGHVPTAKNIPMSTILGSPQLYLDKNEEYYIICQSGGRSSKTCEALSTNGFKVVNVSGGTGSYIKPLERK